MYIDHLVRTKIWQPWRRMAESLLSTVVALVSGDLTYGLQCMWWWWLVGELSKEKLREITLMSNLSAATYSTFGWMLSWW